MGARVSTISSLLNQRSQFSRWYLTCYVRNGPVSVEVAKRAMSASLDLPLYHGSEPNHYELHIDSTSFREKEKWDLKRMYHISKNMATMTKTSLVPMMSKAMVEAERIRPHVMEGLRLLLRYR